MVRLHADMVVLQFKLIAFGVGEPLYEGEPLQHLGSHTPPREDQERPPSDISFVRNRMLYARAALSARGLVHFGLRHIRKCTPQAWISCRCGH